MSRANKRTIKFEEKNCTSFYQGKILACKMVCAKKFLTPQQMKESNTTETWKAKRRMLICGNFARDT
eukprot:5694354-Prorocentrum_lima.AAC.1